MPLIISKFELIFSTLLNNFLKSFFDACTGMFLIKKNMTKNVIKHWRVNILKLLPSQT